MRTFLIWLMLARGALAGAYYWSGNGSTLGGGGTWDDTVHWGTNAAGPFSLAWPNVLGDEAVFANTAGTVTLSGTITASKLTFLTNAYTLTGGTLNLGGDASVISTTNFAANANHYMYSPIAGSGTLTLLGKASFGYGTFLAASNGAFTGKIVVDRLGNYFGLVVTNDNALGAVPATYTADAITLKNGAFLISGSSATLALAANRGITVMNGTTLYGNTFVLNGPMVGTAGSVTFRNTTATLNSALNSYAGETWPDNSTLIMGVDNGLPHGAGKGNLNFNDYDGVSTVNLNGHTLTINGLTGRSTTGNFLLSKMDNTNASPATLVVGDGDATGISFVGIITNRGGALSLIKIGAGTQTLGGKSYYSGGTTVNGGTLRINGQASPNSGTGPGLVTVNTGGTLSGAGYIAGGVTVASAASAVLYPNAGGQMVLGGDLTVGANAAVKFDLGPSGLSGNDQVVLQNKTITGNDATITIHPVSGVLDQANDYVLLDAGASGTIASGFNPVPAWAGTAPWWASSCSILTVSNQVRLRCTNLPDVKYLLDFGGIRDTRDWYLLGVLQGLVNRDEPRLFITHNEIDTSGAGNLWPQWFQSEKGYSFVTLPSLGEAINLFKNMNGTNGQPLIQGLVKYQDVKWNPAITNYNDTYYQYWVAANFAAQENLLPVCADTLAHNTTALSAGSYWYVDTMANGGWARMFAEASYTADGLAVTAGTDAYRAANMGSYWYKWVYVDLSVTPKIEITVSALSPGGQWGFAVDLGSTVNLYPNAGRTRLYTNMTGVGVFTFDLKNSGLFNPLSGRAGLHICAMTTNTTVTVRQIRFLTASNTVPATMFYKPPTNEFNGLNIIRDLTDTNAYPQMTNEATACAWAVQNQFPLCNSNATLWLANSYYSMTDLDEAIANRSFIFNQNSIANPFFQSAVNYSNILSSLVPPARISGWQSWGEDYMIAYYARYGARLAATSVANMSFWERVPSSGVKLPQNRQVTKLEPKFYVNFTWASGDGIGFPAGFWLGWWFDPMRGQIPNTWGVNTVLAELAPALLEFYAQTATPLDSFFSGPNGAGYAHPYDMTPAQAALYAHQTRVNMEALGLTPAVDWAWGKAYFTQTSTDHSQPIGLFTPWNWQKDKNAHTDWMDDGTPVIYPERSAEHSLTGSKEGDGKTTPMSMASNIMAVVSAHPEGGPFFITCNTRFSPTFYSQVMSQLNPDLITVVGMQDFLNLSQEAGGFTVIPQALNVGAGDTLRVSIELHNADGTTGGAGTISWILPPGWSANEPQWVHDTVPQRGVLKHIVTFTTPPVALTNATPATLVFKDSRVSWVRQVTVTNCPSGQTISDCSSTNGWTVSGGASLTVTNLVGLTNGLIRLTPAVVQRRSDYLLGSRPSNGKATLSLGQVDFSRQPVLEVNLPVAAMSYNMSFGTIVKVVNGSGSSKQLDSSSESKLLVLNMAALTGWTGVQTVTLEIYPCNLWGNALDVGDVRLYYYGAAPGTNNTSLMSPLQSQDIGPVGVAGASAFSSGVYTVQGAGASLTATNDAFQFVYAMLVGDGTIIARVASQQNTAAGAAAGVMMRQSLSAGAPEASVVITPGNGVLFQSRAVTNGSTDVSQILGPASPFWVKLTRSGSLFTAYYSTTGSDWIELGAPQIVVMSDPIYVGLVVCSYDAASLNASTFDNVSFPGQSLPPAPGGLVAAAGNAQLTVSWNSVPGAVGYNLKRATVSGGLYVPVGQYLDSTSFTDTALHVGTNYYYVVSAVNSSGEGANSAEVQAPTLVPTTPPDISADVLDGNLTVSWPAHYIGWRLQDQSNGLSSTNWTMISGSETTTIWTLPMDRSADIIRFYRLIYP